MAVDDKYTVSLLHFDGADQSTTFIDESGKSWTASGNAQIDTAQKKFGSGSGLFDGAGDYLSVPDHVDFTLGSDDFTIDMWVRPSVINQTNKAIAAQAGVSGANNTVAWYLLYQSDESIQGAISSGSTLYTVTSPISTYAANTWLHIALIRNGNNLYLAYGGTLTSATDVTGVSVNNSSGKLAIGRYGDYADLYSAGWIDEFRMSKGVARWNTNFTPETKAYSPPAILASPCVTNCMVL